MRQASIAAPAHVRHFEEGFELGQRLPSRHRHNPAEIARLVSVALSRVEDAGDADLQLPRMLSGLVHGLKQASHDPRLGVLVADALLAATRGTDATGPGDANPPRLTLAQCQSCLHAIAMASHRQWGHGPAARRIDYATGTASHSVLGVEGQARGWSKPDAETFRQLTTAQSSGPSPAAGPFSWAQEGDLAVAWRNGVAGVDLRPLWPDEGPPAAPEVHAELLDGAEIDTRENAVPAGEVAQAAPAQHPLAHWLEAIEQLRPIETMTPAQLRKALACLDGLPPAALPPLEASAEEQEEPVEPNSRRASIAPPVAPAPEPLAASEPDAAAGVDAEAPALPEEPLGVIPEAPPLDPFPPAPGRASFQLLREVLLRWDLIIETLHRQVSAVRVGHERLMQVTAGHHVQRALAALWPLSHIYQQLTAAPGNRPLASRIDAWVADVPKKAFLHAIARDWREVEEALRAEQAIRDRMEDREVPDAPAVEAAPVDPWSIRENGRTRAEGLDQVLRNALANLNAEISALGASIDRLDPEEDEALIRLEREALDRKQGLVDRLTQTRATFVERARDAEERAAKHAATWLHGNVWDDGPTLDRQLTLLSKDLGDFLPVPEAAPQDRVPGAEPRGSAPQVLSQLVPPADGDAEGDQDDENDADDFGVFDE